MDRSPENSAAGAGEWQGHGDPAQSDCGVSLARESGQRSSPSGSHRSPGSAQPTPGRARTARLQPPYAAPMNRTLLTPGSGLPALRLPRRTRTASDATGRRIWGSDASRAGGLGRLSGRWEHVGSGPTGAFRSRRRPPLQSLLRTDGWRQRSAPGHFTYPDPSQWTDEELGIPPDDED
ncbi:NADH dehydrogenase [ubiquinone] 1 beta subcomplex subunit 2, mitochondrial isoform X1 [Marmota marmota marmota]|uniref:NADH dehydrogenase [ubiquinone] 1 beta subcomplex subunit 2, mitochondrial isoform X1 n=1 Tax=Marmota marmota marmota TaxID=9994 RepID=UPI002093B474|nr:NADH dehydrogenase [ubiquinone] 1 beta subcomplex subunit 2, mitochondrial isoform X1 [Marmota marmota marmota]